MWQLTNEDQARLIATHIRLGAESRNMLGYPLNMNSPMKRVLELFLDHVTNNLGDPFIGSSCQLQTFELERDVVQHFGRLFGGENVWGYVTSCGSEGNFVGIDAGLSRFPNASIVCTSQAHYSVKRTANMARANLIEIPSHPTGAMDTTWLIENIVKAKAKSVVVVLTAGTTMTGAIDDVIQAKKKLDLLGIDHYIHVDAALAGAMLPYWEKSPKFGFDVGADSVSVSGHKFYGCPVPCGVYVQRSEPQCGDVEYVGTRASTLFGSRTGLGVVALWCAIRGYSESDMQAMVKQCRDNAMELFDRISDIQNGVWINDFSTTVVFKRPSDWIVRRYQLACEGDEAHIVVMPHVTKALINRFVLDLRHSHKGAKAKDAVANNAG